LAGNLKFDGFFETQTLTSAPYFNGFFEFSSNGKPVISGRSQFIYGSRKSMTQKQENQEVKNKN
jgi:hypothetical protein